VGVALADILTGMYATTAIQAALLEREQSGKGQYIDLALLDVQAATLANQASNYLVGGEVPQRLGNAHPNIVPYQAFATRDGFMILAVGNDEQFRKFSELVGRVDLANDQRYASNRARVENREVLCEIVQEILLDRSTDEWIKALEAISVPCGPINRIDQVFDEPQIQSRKMQVDLPHSLVDKVSLVGNPIKFSRTPVQLKDAPPLLGQHSDEVLRELLGYSEQQIKELLKQ
jgi:crotonobetainyl-CoA:carnitine CoA-transferase CaiB-like acyl-CoA transferase